MPKVVLKNKSDPIPYLLQVQNERNISKNDECQQQTLNHALILVVLLLSVLYNEEEMAKGTKESLNSIETFHWFHKVHYTKLTNKLLNISKAQCHSTNSSYTTKHRYQVRTK